VRIGWLENDSTAPTEPGLGQEMAVARAVGLLPGELDEILCRTTTLQAQAQVMV
jgi:hypothetical protein